MLKVKDIAFTAYAVTDLARSREFYEGVLGLKPTILKEGMPWVEYEIGPATLGIGVSEKWKPSRDGASIAIEVENFDEAIAELKGKGVTFEMGPLETPVCFMAVLRDPDGSKICIHHRKAGACYV
jgi:catechol 2,3-dioxygenase-like lactoylglutathione lyase family enzyme